MNTTSIKYTLAILLAPLAAHAQRTPSTTATSIQPAPTAPLGKKWKLAFSDEFDGKAIGGTKWKPINNADWVHPDFKTRQAKENCALDGQGNLVIRVSRDADADGRIQSVQLFAKGYLRAESKLDTPQVDQSFTLSNLLKLDIESDFLEPLKKRNGAYVGVGILLDAASRLGIATSDERVKAIRDRVAQALIAAQEDDGYIGYKPPADRVWKLFDPDKIAQIILGRSRRALPLLRATADKITKEAGLKGGADARTKV